MSSDEEDTDCPLCMEELDIADRNFRPCSCGYQICRFCWHHIKTNLNGRCPACRRLYSEQIVEFIPVSAEEVMRLKKEKKEKDRQTREMRDPSRRQLSSIRVVQKSLVYVLGMSLKHAYLENEIFKRFGKVDKVVISKRLTGSSNSSAGIYVTFARKEDAGKAIEYLNGAEIDGKTVRASYGTTKYCTYYLRHMSCPNPNCMYLHEPGDDVDSYNKDNVALGKHSASSSTPTYPNKKPVKVEPKEVIKPSTTPRTWAPIPKVVPPPPPPPVVHEPMVIATSPVKEKTKPAMKHSKSGTTKKAAVATEKSKKPKPLSEEEERPALPASASWAKAQPVVSSESVTTPTHFGPSLSDALQTLQKPKGSTSAAKPAKKEKKGKGRMVRLEEFEEAQKAKPAEEAIQEEVAAEKEWTRHDLESESGVQEPERKSPEQEPMEDARVEPETRPEPVEEKAIQAPELDPLETEAAEPLAEQKEEPVERYPEPEQEEALDSLEGETELTQVEEDTAPVEGLDSLNKSVIKAFESNMHAEETMTTATDLAEPRVQESASLTTSPDLSERIPSPLVAMERLNTLVEQEIRSDAAQKEAKTPEPTEWAESHAMPAQALAMHPMPPPEMLENSSGFEHRRQPMPPPGLPGPPMMPEWMNRGFDPFNGQDPSLIAVRRLQHSQRMMEASGLFGMNNGFPPHRPPPPPPPPPSMPPFGFHPGYNEGFSHPPPPLFANMMARPPPPHLMRNPLPEHVNMSPAFGSPMDEAQLRAELNAMHLNREDFQSRENLRALLPNANISFNHQKEAPLPMRRMEGFYRQTSPDMVRTEAQNFFGEFLRKAQDMPVKKEEEFSKTENPIMFQDPAIMSVRLAESHGNESNQHAILQILGGQTPSMRAQQALSQPSEPVSVGQTGTPTMVERMAQVEESSGQDVPEKMRRESATAGEDPRLPQERVLPERRDSPQQEVPHALGGREGMGPPQPLHPQQLQQLRQQQQIQQQMHQQQLQQQLQQQMHQQQLQQQMHQQQLQQMHQQLQLQQQLHPQQLHSGLMPPSLHAGGPMLGKREGQKMMYGEPGFDERGVFGFPPPMFNNNTSMPPPYAPRFLEPNPGMVRPVLFHPNEPRFRNNNQPNPNAS